MIGTLLAAELLDLLPEKYREHAVVAGGVRG